MINSMPATNGALLYLSRTVKTGSPDVHMVPGPPRSYTHSSDCNAWPKPQPPRFDQDPSLRILIDFYVLCGPAAGPQSWIECQNGESRTGDFERGS